MGESNGDSEKKVDNNSANNEKWTWVLFSAPITIISQ
jgi:hypothetical protein